MKLLKTPYFRYLLAALVGMGIGWSLKPQKTKVEVREVIIEVAKNYTGLKETIIRVERPDGSVETRTDRTAETAAEKSKEKSKVSIKEGSLKPQWQVGGYMSVLEDNTYTLTIDRRILGNVFVGVYGRTDLDRHDVGLGLRIEF